MAREVINDTVTNAANAAHVGRDATVAAVKAAPPVYAIVDSALNGWNMNHTVGAVTIAYLLVQIGYVVWKWSNERADRRRAQREQTKRQECAT